MEIQREKPKKKVSLENRTDTYTDVDAVSFPSVPTEDVKLNETEINSIGTIENPSLVVEATTQQKTEEVPQSVVNEDIVQTKFLGEEYGIRSLLPTIKVSQEEIVEIPKEIVEQKPIYPELIYEFNKTVSPSLLEEPNEIDAFKSVPIEESFNDKMLFHDNAFYLLLNKYLESQISLDNAKYHIDQSRAATDYSQVWELQEHSLTHSAPCKDKIAIQETIIFQKSIYNAEKAVKLQENFEMYENVLYKEFVQKLFESKMSKLEVELYIEKVLNTKFIKSIDPEGPVIAFTDQSSWSENITSDLQVLRQCIYVLFWFEQIRKNESSEEIMYKNIFYYDVRNWIKLMCSILLRTAFKSDHLFLMEQLVRCVDINTWGVQFIQLPKNMYDLDFFIRMLCTLLKPVKLKGESEFVLKEDDFVGCLEQFPFGGIFTNLFQSSLNEAFKHSNHLVEILSTSIYTFRHFKYFTKKLAQTLIILINTAKISLESSTEKKKFEHLFVKIFRALLILEDSGVWQFVAMMPFRLISQSTMWKLLVHLYTLPMTNPPNIEVSSFEEWNIKVIQDMTIVQPFVTMLINNNQSVFLLHTLAKIVTESTQDFATSLITELLRICYVIPESRSVFYKTGREVFEIICTKNPSFISILFDLCTQWFSMLGGNVLYLFKNLPLLQWKPPVSILGQLRQWLLMPLDSNENVFAQFMLESLNWNVDNRVNGLLVLDPEFHKCVMLIVAEVYIAHTSKSRGYLLQNKPVNFIAWCWRVLHHLKVYSVQGVPLISIYNGNSPDVQFLLKAANTQTETVDSLVSFVILLLTDVNQHFLNIRYSMYIKSIINDRQSLALLKVFAYLIPTVVRTLSVVSSEVFKQCMNFIMREEISSVDPLSILKTFTFFKSLSSAPYVINQNTFWLRSLIIDHILLSNLHSLLSFWLQGILSTPDRYGDRSCCFLLNDIFKCVLLLDIQQTQKMILPHQENLLKYRAKPEYFRQLKDEFPNLLFFILYVETLVEQDVRTRLYDKMLQTKSHINTVKESKHIDDFVIYKWAELILKLDPLDSLLPLSLQMFFALFIEEKTSFQSTQFLTRNTKLDLKAQLANKLDVTCKYFVTLKERETSLHGPSYKDESLHSQYITLYRAMYLWLTEGVNSMYFTHDPRLQSLKSAPSIHDLRLWTDIANLSSLEDYLLTQQKLWRQFSMDSENPIIETFPNMETHLENYLQDKQIELPVFSVPLHSINEYIVDHKLYENLQGDIQVLYTHADDISMLRAKQQALDSFLMEKLPLLYENEPLTVRKEKVCKASKCEGAAVFVFEVTHPKMDLHIHGLIEQNRDDVALLQGNLDISREMCVSLIKIEKAIRLIDILTKTNNLPIELYNVGIRLFYRFVEVYTESCLQFPPTNDFIKNIIKVLADCFILRNTQEVTNVLKSVLQSPAIRVPLLTPYFNPGMDSPSIPHLYKMLMTAHKNPSNVSILLPLFTKIEVKDWLQIQPTTSAINDFIEMLIKAVGENSAEDSNLEEVKDFYIHSFNVIATFGHPANFFKVSSLLIEQTSHNISPHLFKYIVETSLKDLDRNVLVDIVNMIYTYLFNYRQSLDKSSKTLYSAWSNYLSIYLNFVHLLIKHPQILPSSSAVQYISNTTSESVAWSCLYKLLLPFLSPVYLDNSLFQIPIWLPHEISAASEVLSTLIEETCLIQKYFAKTVSHFWMFFYNTFGYVLSMIPPQIEQLLQHFMSKIPWEQFQVTTENVAQITFLLSNCIVNNKLAIFFMLRDMIPRLGYSGLPPSIELLSLFTLVVQLHPLPIDHSFITTLEPIFRKFMWTQLTVENYHALLTNDEFLKNFVGEKVESVRLEEKLNVVCTLVCVATGSDEAKKKTLSVESVQSCISKLEIYLKFLHSLATTNPLSSYRVLFSQLLDYFTYFIKNTTESIISSTSYLLSSFMDIFNFPQMPINTLVELLPKYHSLIPHLIRASCLSLTSIQKLSLFTEEAMEAYFIESANWKLVTEYVLIPEITEVEYLKYCVEHGYVLNLYTYSLHRFSMVESLEGQIKVMDQLLMWNNELNPQKFLGKEYKILLLWFKIVQIFWNYLKVNPTDKIKTLLFIEFANSTLKYGEDKKLSGLLGVFGVGEKSPFSVPFRLCCKLLGIFLLTQIKENGALRTMPNYEPLSISKPIEKLLSSLNSAVRAPEYQTHTTTVQTCQNFITDSTKTLEHISTFMYMITSRLFPEQKMFTFIL